MTKPFYIKLRINAPDVGGYKQGQIVTIPTDEYCVPIDRYWRNRIEDSAIDNCVTIVQGCHDNPLAKKVKKGTDNE